MNILFQSKKIDLTRHEENFMARRLENLEKFFSPHARAFVDVEHTKGGRLDSGLYYVSINVEDAKINYFADEYKEDLRKAFDHAFGDIFRIIRNDRSKSRRLLKKAGLRFKKVFKRKYR